MRSDNARLAREQLDKGNKLQHAGNAGLARSHYERAAKLDPHNPQVWYALGTAWLAAARVPLAVKHLRKCIELAPSFAQAHHALGLALHRSGRLDAAIGAYRDALARRERYGEALVGLAAALAATGDPVAAEHAYRQALDWRAGDVDAAVGLGQLLRRQGRLDAAVQVLRAAQQVAPSQAQICGDLAAVLSASGRYGDAVHYARIAVAQQPERALWWRVLGVAERLLHDIGHALGSLRRALELDPDDQHARFEFAVALREAGAIDEARAALAQVTAPEGHAERLRWDIALSLPAIYRDDAHLAIERARFAAGLAQVDAGLRLDTPERVAQAYRAAIAVAPFYLHYQPFDNTELQCRFGDLITRVMSHAAPQWSQPCDWQPLAHGGRLRIGFVSNHLMRHTVSRYFGALITGLDPQRFDVRVWYGAGIRDDSTESIAARVAAFTHTRADALDVAAQIQAARLDVLVYPEVGMDPHHQALAALRLAPVQCALYGHPATSGLPNVDYYISADAFEPPDAQCHYRERLVRLPGLGTQPQRPPSAGVGAWIDAYAEGAPLLLCLQNPLKLMPAFDATLARIAAESAARIGFFVRNPPLTERFRERIAARFAAHGLDPARQLAFLPAQVHADYLAGIARVPLVLDSPGFSGGATSLDAFSVATPVLAWEGPMARGRQTAAMLRIIDCDELIAGSEDEYVAKAVALCRDESRRTALRERIRVNGGSLFEDASAIAAFAEFVEKAATQAAV